MQLSYKESDTKRFSLKHQRWLFAALFIGPALIAIIFIMAYPIFKGVSTSFTDRLFTYDKYSFIGIQNYLTILKDNLFWHSLFNSIKFTFWSVLGSLPIGLGLALLLNNTFRFKNVFQGILFLPWVMPSMVTALIFRWIYNDFYGYANYILTKYHIIETPVNLLSDTHLVWYGVLIPVIWGSYPFIMMVFLAALQGIDKTLYEAAHIDGANRLQSFLFITLPNLKPAFILVIILEIIWGLSSFDMVYLLTGGGPDNVTLTLSLYIYRQAFEAKALGYGSALGTVLFMVLFAFTILYFEFLRRTKIYED